MVTRFQGLIWAAVLLAPAAFSGCTHNLWSEHGVWPVERNQYVAIEQAALGDPNGRWEALFFRVRRSASGLETWRLRFVRPRNETERFILGEAEPVPDAEFPDSQTGSVYVLTTLELEQEQWSSVRDRAPTLLSISPRDIGDLFPPRIGIVDARWLDHGMWEDLPYPAVAWNSTNALGHVLLTPLTVVLDVAFFPVWLFLAAVGKLY